MLLTNLRLTADIADLNPEVIENNALIPDSDELQGSFAELLRQPQTAAIPLTDVADAAGQPIPAIVPDGSLPSGGNALPQPATLASNSLPVTSSAATQEVLPELATETGIDHPLPALGPVDLNTLQTGASDDPVPLPSQASDDIADWLNRAATADLPLTSANVAAMSTPTAGSLADQGQRAAGTLPAAEVANATRAAAMPADAAAERAVEQELRNQVDLEALRQAMRSRTMTESSPTHAARPLPAESLPSSAAVPIADITIDKADVGVRTSGESFPQVAGAASVDAAQARDPAQGAARSTPLQTTVPLAVSDDGWAEAFGERVTWLSRGGIQSAELRLNPAELGPVRVQVSVEDDAARLTFTAAHAVTREAIEQALPRLREMLSESGLTLAGTDINESGTREEREAGRDSTGELVGDAAADASGDAPEHAASGAETALGRPAQGLVDTFV